MMKHESREKERRKYLALQAFYLQTKQLLKDLEDKFNSLKSEENEAIDPK